jgi:hypothetical protein
MAALPNLAQLPLTLLLFYGSVSRLTHGAYTPGFYAFQIARMPDDGSATASAVPLGDLTLGLAMLAAPRRWKWRAAAFASITMAASAAKLLLMDGLPVGDVVVDLAVTAVGLVGWMGS